LDGTLETCGHMSIEDFRTMFETAADQRDAGDIAYNTRLGNKLLRILWQNY